MNEQGKKMWSNLFSNNSVAANGMPLSYISPQSPEDRDEVLYSRMSHRIMPNDIFVTRPSDRYFDTMFNMIGDLSIVKNVLRFGMSAMRNTYSPLKDKGNPRRSNFYCVMIVVYGINTIEERKELWIGLMRIGNVMSIPWCITGDFNTPLMQDDIMGGQPVADFETRDF
ncbi:hypothetical protein HAX54_052957 [Datura stramonium]|uniref:Uncharacterized protein n=1 Tax=Datura stramonium TaxID=4076 RepID=A0ABS8T0A5_DATST|nr:hypothetical protein [Datura stramonium]